jgi:biopolymer transport protein ExbB
MKRALLVFIALLFAATGAHAQQPKGLDELLKQIKQGGAQAAKLNAEREARFLKNKNEQAAELAKAEGQAATAKSRADGVKARFDAHQKEIADLKAQLSTRAGDYTQVYATVRQLTGDFRTVAADSLVTAQFPERMAFLDRIATGTELPSVDDLESLWYELQEEMTENGKVVKFTTDVIDSQGARRKAEVVRVGPFSAFADGEYLTLSGTNLVALPHALGGYGDVAEDFAALKEGWGAALIDPTRGNVLALSAERPTAKERVDQGGTVAYIIIVIGVVGACLAAFQLVYLLLAGVRTRRQLHAIETPDADNPLGRVLGVLRSETSDDPELLELHLSEAVLRETPKLERFQSTLRMIVAAGPLLGLLGTVSGMIVTFQVITEVGAADPKAMAGGIAQAMISTLLGLGIALPLLFVNSVLSSRSRVLVQILDEQSAGLLAKRLEASRGRV